MSEIVVQPLEEQFLDGFHLVRSLTYNNGDPIPPERRGIESPGMRSFIARSGDKVLGVCTVLDMTATRGQALLPCAGVAGVAVLPEMRKSGVGSAMMSWLVNHLRETGTPLSSLYAFREPFYRRFGYEIAGRRLKFSCPTHRWPKIRSDLPVYRLTPNDWEQLIDCYSAFAHSRSGLNVRTQSQWQRVLGENRQLTIYAVGQPVEAYAVVSHQTQFWSTDHTSEIAWSTRRGYDGILEMLGGLAINKEGLSWFEPSDGPFYNHYMDAGIDVKLERPIMFRVTDVETSLRSLRPDPVAVGEFVAFIEDRTVHSNNGSWHVRFGDGDVHVEKVSDDHEWDFKMSVQSFAQAFLGEPGLADLAGQGSIDISTPKALQSALSLMPTQSTYCMDFF